jgi:acyl-CoA thioesterase I
MIPSRLTAIFILWFFGMNFCSALSFISCVGDSITAGVGVPQALVSIQSYPARLQQLMGTNYDVGNFGVSGTTLLTNGDMPYVDQSSTFFGSQRFGPIAIIIMLGSNDSKPQNWVYGADFYADYVNLIAVYTNLSSHPRVLLCTPPPCFGNNTADINPGIVATNISPLIRELGTNLNLQVIDFQSLLAGHNEWFPDNVHPNPQGAEVMAAIVYTALQGDTLNGSIPSLGINTLTNKNVILNWPAGGAGWVLQSTSALGDTNAWIIATNSHAIGNNQTSILFTNPIEGTNTMFRLWNPSPTNN